MGTILAKQWKGENRCKKCFLGMKVTLSLNQDWRFKKWTYFQNPKIHGFTHDNQSISSERLNRFRKKNNVLHLLGSKEHHVS